MRFLRSCGNCGFALLIGCVFVLGCANHPPPLSAPNYHPEESARLALQEYDANKDGKLDAQELERCPGLKASLTEIDTNHDNALDAEELAARFRQYQRLNAAVVAVRCRVERDGAPVAGFKVTLTPEAFMAGAVQAAQGTSEEIGRVVLQGEGGGPAGLAPGFYRVEVASPEDGKTPALAPDSTNGYEAMPPARGERAPVVVRLNSSQ